MRPEIRRNQQAITTQELALASSLAALLAASTFIPLTPFIGGPGFITLAIVMLPIIAAILRPVPATATALVGALVMVVSPQLNLYTVFGFFGLLIPVIAVAAGSVAFHHKIGPVIPWAYVLTGAAYYLAYSQGGTLFWLVPYGLVVVSLPVALRASGTLNIGLLALYTAMCEQVTMNVLSISLAHIVGPAWTAITPLMYLERTLATVGGATAIIALKSILGTRIELSHFLREVN